MIFLRPTNGAKQVMKKWIEELQGQPWSGKAKSNDQLGFNWALNKTAGQCVIFYVDFSGAGRSVFAASSGIPFRRVVLQESDMGPGNQGAALDDHAQESPLGRVWNDLIHQTKYTFFSSTKPQLPDSLIWKYGVMELLTVCLAYKNDIEGQSKHCDGTEEEMARVL
ncbi:hypothetical protein IFM89_032980 [Coptis chinensis]|uniref:Uncharacterized protein n=1 Tax=Coptis chinensis TaxID=261450 RepID=A0A835LS89_9MAGN|nr:hypothetical protein IFM89_032980 [Coptis chinensis]